MVPSLRPVQRIMTTSTHLRIKAATYGSSGSKLMALNASNIFSKRFKSGSWIGGCNIDLREKIVIKTHLWMPEEIYGSSGSSWMPALIFG